MSLYGKKWMIDGVVAAMIRRSGANGGYTVLFEREFASLEQIEAINWARPTVTKIGSEEAGVCLPEGYEFELAGIRYSHNCKTWEVELKVAKQYLGDVTGYQEEIAALQAHADESAATIAELESALAEADELAIALYEAQQTTEETGEESAEKTEPVEEIVEETTEETASETAEEVQE